MRPASAVIVGAGVMGASVAYHLTARGWRDVLLLDRCIGPGRGSTGAATGGFRAQYASAINVRLSLLARQKLRCFKDEIGIDPGYLPAGYLWLATAEPELDVLRAGLQVQWTEGLHEASEVSPDEIGRLNPALRPEAVIGGTFCPTDGFIAPHAVLNGYLAAALRNGARVEWETNVTGLCPGGSGRITAVESSRGRIGADIVINAAGAWAAEWCESAGLRVPVSPLRRQVAATV
ncbi:MAG TPA: FAD-dependent oxidoreductase, partial [Gemmatimonadales bacterium]|nr:FAD-dependent oxidoreductase [Gemmatimonadales bacterium]